MSKHESNDRFRPSSDLTEQRIDWLWPGRLAPGKPALLEGDPGLGKSLKPIAQVVPDEYMVLVMCQSEQEQLALLQRFGAEGLSCKALLS